MYTTQNSENGSVLLSVLIVTALKRITDVNNKFQESLDRIGMQEQEVKRYTDMVNTHYLKNLEGGLEALSMKEASDYQRLASLLQDLGQPINRIETQLKSIQDSLDKGK